MPGVQERTPNFRIHQPAQCYQRGPPSVHACIYVHDGVHAYVYMCIYVDVYRHVRMYIRIMLCTIMQTLCFV